MLKRSHIDDLRLDSPEVKGLVVDAYLLGRIFLLEGRMMGIHDYEIGVFW